MYEPIIIKPTCEKERRSFRVAVCGNSAGDIRDFVNTVADCLVYSDLLNNNNLALCELFAIQSGLFDEDRSKYEAHCAVACSMETPNVFPLRVPSLHTDIYLDAAAYFDNGGSINSDSGALVKHLCGSDCAIVVDSESPATGSRSMGMELSRVFTGLPWESVVALSNFSPMVKTLQVPYNWKSVMGNTEITRDSKCSYIFSTIFNAATFLNNLRPGEITTSETVDSFCSVSFRARKVLSKIKKPPTSCTSIEIVETLSATI